MALAALYCASAKAEQYLPDIQRIVDNKKIVVAMTAQDIPPMVMVNKDGALAGIDIGLARDIATKLGVPVEFSRKAKSEDGVIRQVAAGQADIGISNLSRSVDWASLVLLTKPYLVQTPTVLIGRVKALQRGSPCPSRADLRQFAEQQPQQVGVLAGSSYLIGIRRESSKISPKKFSSLSDMMDALQKGEVAVTSQGEIIGKYFLRKHPRAAIRFRLCEVDRPDDQLAIAVRPDAPNLLRWLNVYIETELQPLDVDQLINDPTLLRTTR